MRRPRTPSQRLASAPAHTSPGPRRCTGVGNTVGRYVIIKLPGPNRQIVLREVTISGHYPPPPPSPPPVVPFVYYPRTEVSGAGRAPSQCVKYADPDSQEFYANVCKQNHIFQYKGDSVSYQQTSAAGAAYASNLATWPGARNPSKKLCSRHSQAHNNLYGVRAARRHPSPIFPSTRRLPARQVGYAYYGCRDSAYN